jgi:hypothetical protein
MKGAAQSMIAFLHGARLTPIPRHSLESKSYDMIVTSCLCVPLWRNGNAILGYTRINEKKSTSPHYIAGSTPARGFRTIS